MRLRLSMRLWLPMSLRINHETHTQMTLNPKHNLPMRLRLPKRLSLPHIPTPWSLQIPTPISLPAQCELRGWHDLDTRSNCSYPTGSSDYILSRTWDIGQWTNRYPKQRQRYSFLNKMVETPNEVEPPNEVETSNEVESPLPTHTLKFANPPTNLPPYKCANF